MIWKKEIYNYYKLELAEENRIIIYFYYRYYYIIIIIIYYLFNNIFCKFYKRTKKIIQIFFKKNKQFQSNSTV